MVVFVAERVGFAGFIVFCFDLVVACCLCVFLWALFVWLIVWWTVCLWAGVACLFKFVLLTIYVCCGGLPLALRWFYCGMIDC